MDRIDLYLHRNIPEYYANNNRENELVTKFTTLYEVSKSARDKHEQVNPKILAKWRKAYLGTLNALDINTGEESQRKARQLKKIVYETIESKIDNSLPMPKMVPRYKNLNDVKPVVAMPSSTTLHPTSFEANRLSLNYLRNVGCILTLHSPYICPTLNRQSQENGNL